MGWETEPPSGPLMRVLPQVAQLGLDLLRRLAFGSLARSVECALYLARVRCRPCTTRVGQQRIEPLDQCSDSSGVSGLGEAAVSVGAVGPGGVVHQPVVTAPTR